VSGEPTWEGGSGTFGEFALKGSDFVLRMLLPASVHNRARHATWLEVAAALSREATDIHGYTNWHALVELPGNGESPLGQPFDHPAARIPHECLATLTAVIESVTGPGAPFISAQPVGWSTTTAPLIEVGMPPAVSRRAGREILQAPLPELTARWPTHGFPGRVWAVGQAVAIAAPPYADSLVLSGGLELREALLRSDLEVFTVSRKAPCPITSA